MLPESFLRRSSWARSWRDQESKADTSLPFRSFQRDHSAVIKGKTTGVTAVTVELQGPVMGQGWAMSSSSSEVFGLRSTGCVGDNLEEMEGRAAAALHRCEPPA